MADRADLYEHLRHDISEFVSGLESDALETPVPATPGWSIRDVITHLAADATYAVGAGIPVEFFAAVGDSKAVAVLNDWTGRQLEERKDRSLEELLEEWKTSGDEVLEMMRGEKPWPEGSLPFVEHVIVTDTAVHQQDIFGALGINRGRDSVPIKVGLRTYVAGIGLRLASSGILPLRFDYGEKAYTGGDGEPGATVRASRFELFRATSGRRSPEQVAAYDWEGDPDPYIPYFYPYGIRKDALVE